MNRLVPILLVLFVCSCVSTEGINNQDSNGGDYFPPKGSGNWATLSPESLGWDVSKIPALYKLLDENGTRAFLLIKDGRIVLEHYSGKDLLKIRSFSKEKQWYWASAGKTLTAFITGIAQQEGYLSINDKSSKYLGKGWSSLTRDKEDLITVRHQLTMTSGLDDSGEGRYGFEPSDLVYKADAGTRWAYHNGPYTLLEKVVTHATGIDFNEYFKGRLADKIGMDGQWRWLGNFHIYFSTPRSMARFGLLMLNHGKWDGVSIMSDTIFYSQMITPSQELNKSYGYLWWLNGKESYMFPQSQLVFSGSLFPDAPADMYSGLGKNGQYLSVIPSQNMVMVRMGENPDSSEVAAMFQRAIWEKLNAVMGHK